MSLSMITLLPVLIGFGLLYWSSILDDEHDILATIFQLMFVPLVLVSINFALIDASMVYSSNSELVSRLSSLVFYIGWLFWGIGVYMLFLVVKRIYLFLMGKREEKQEEMYE